MLERVNYRYGICVVCALALLIAVMTSPIRPSRSDNKSFQTTCLTLNYSTPAEPFTRLFFNSAADGNMADTDEFGREAENEEEEECFVRVTGSVSFLVAPPLSTSLKRPAKHANGFGLMQSCPILRC